MIADELKYGFALRRVEPGEPLRIRALLTAEQMGGTEVTLPDAWQLESHELVLGSSRAALSTASVCLMRGAVENVPHSLISSFAAHDAR